MPMIIQKAPLVITLWDDNHYFLHAMRIILTRYFYTKEMSVLFMSPQAAPCADLIVTTVIPTRGRRSEQHRVILLRKQVENGICHQVEVGLQEMPAALEQALDRLVAHTEDTRLPLSGHP